MILINFKLLAHFSFGFWLEKSDFVFCFQVKWFSNLDAREDLKQNIYFTWPNVKNHFFTLLQVVANYLYMYNWT